MNVFYLSIVSLIFFKNINSIEIHFGYSKYEQQHWYQKYEHCGGKYQSPIAIDRAKAIPIHTPSIQMIGFNNLFESPLQMQNNGHTVSVTIPKVSSSNGIKPMLPYIVGGLLADEYEFEEMHFHWGGENCHGSEHVMNGKRYPMEMHIIHRNKKYKTRQDAMRHSDGLCVLAFFYQLTEMDDLHLDRIVRNLQHIRALNSTISMSSMITLRSLIGNIDMERFYTYQGSLTTPPCSEAVRWILFSHSLLMSNSQLETFRLLFSRKDGSAYLVNNFRKLQSLGYRRIYIRRGRSAPIKFITKGSDMSC